MKLLLTIAIIVVALVLWQRTRERPRTRGELLDYPARGEGTDEDVMRFLLARRKLTAIKLYREIHGVGLKEAKEAVERMTLDPPQQKEPR